jgi:integrase
MSSPYGLGGIFRPAGTSRYWIRYSHNGKQIRESSGSTSESKARALLKKRLGEIEVGKFSEPSAKRITVGELLDGLMTRYQIEKARSFRNTKSVIKHLRRFFAEDRAVEITTPRLRQYVAERQHRQAADASIKRELAHLRLAFRQAVEDNRLNAVPLFPKIKVENVRKGFVNPSDFERLHSALPDYLRAPVEFLYLSGWRSHEMRTLRWKDVDLDGREIILDSANDKTGKGRVAPLRGRLLELIENVAHYRRLDCPFVFHRDGKPLGQLSRPFAAAAERAGLSWLKPHDLRRSTVRNLLRAGIREKVAMSFTGHASRAVFDRYTIVAPEDQAEAADQLYAYLGDAEQIPTKVTVLNSSRKLA